MQSKKDYSNLSIFLGGLTLVLFAAKPYILDLIEPAKSIGQLIGENAKDMLDSMQDKGDLKRTSSKRMTYPKRSW